MSPKGNFLCYNETQKVRFFNKSSWIHHYHHPHPQISLLSTLCPFKRSDKFHIFSAVKAPILSSASSLKALEAPNDCSLIIQRFLTMWLIDRGGGFSTFLKF